MNEAVSALKENLSKVMSQPFWHRKVPMAEKVEYLKNIASARANLWNEVEKEFPHAKSISYTVTSSFVTYTDSSEENPELLTEQPHGK